MECLRGLRRSSADNLTRLRRGLRPEMASFVDSSLLEPARFPFDGRVHCVAVAPGIAPGAGVLSGGKHAARGGPMQVSEILKVKGNALFTIAPEGKLTDAVSVMAQHNMGSLVVIDKGRMVGMLTFGRSEERRVGKECRSRW